MSMFQIVPPRQPTPAPNNSLFNDSERRRFIGYVGALVLVVGGFAATFMNYGTGDKDATREQAAQEVELLRSQIALPALRIDRYRTQAKDATREERAVLESDALETALADARLYNEAHFEPLNGADLTKAMCAELLENSQESRGKIVRVRGLIEDMIRYEGVNGALGHSRGRVTLEDGGECFVAFITSGDIELGAGDFLALEGFFLKNFSQNVPGAVSESGARWVEGPLIVGPRAVRSYPDIGRVTSISPEDFLGVEDDSVYGGLRPTPSSYWKLLAYARDFDPNSVDWANAPVLDGETMQKLAADPASFRGKPMRIPACVVQDIWTGAKRENPGRFTRLTEGWLGSYEWIRTLYPVVRFDSPAPNPGLRKTNQMTANGFFFRIHSYDSAGHGTQFAPLFVLATMTPYTPPPDTALNRVLIIAGVSFVGILIVFMFMMSRDQKKHDALNAQLVQRRRMRRERAQQTAQ